MKKQELRKTKGLPWSLKLIVLVSLVSLINLVFNYRYYSTKTIIWLLNFYKIQGSITVLFYFLSILVIILTIFVILKKKKWGWYPLVLISSVLSINSLASVYGVFAYLKSINSSMINANMVYVTMLSLLSFYILFSVYRNKRYFIN